MQGSAAAVDIENDAAVAEATGMMGAATTAEGPEAVAKTDTSMVVVAFGNLSDIRTIVESAPQCSCGRRD